MEVGIVENKTFKVSSTSSFTVKERVINKQRFIDYRSLIVNIDGNEYKPRSSGSGYDRKLSEALMRFLKIRENIDHINLLSKVLNGFPYFEIYDVGVDSKTSRSGGLKINELETNSKTGRSAGLRINELETNSKTSGSGGLKINELETNSKTRRSPGLRFSELEVKSDLIGSKDILLPNKVLECVHEGIDLERPLSNTIDYYPIWRWEGSKQNHRVSHWIHFDILVYILSSIFVELRKEFMALLTVELHISEVRNSDLESETRSRIFLLEHELEVARIERDEFKSKYEATLKALTDSKSNFEIEMQKMRDKMKIILDEADSKANELNSKLSESNSKVYSLTNQLIESNSKVDELNSRLIETTQTATDLGIALNSFTPMSASTHTIEFVLKLYLSEFHPVDQKIRTSINDDEIWVGVFCGEESNFSTSVKDINAKVLITYPVNSRDTLNYINESVLDKFVERYYYKHFTVKVTMLRRVFQRIGEVLISNDCITGNTIVNDSLVDELIDRFTIEEIRMDPEVITPPKFNFDELKCHEYYYKKCYRKIQIDEAENRIYFFVGSGRNRIREYITVDSLRGLRSR